MARFSDPSGPEPAVGIELVSTGQADDDCAADADRGGRQGGVHAGRLFPATPGVPVGVIPAQV